MVSVIIPCYNTGDYLVEAIQSVLRSGFDDYEIIVVDDGSDSQETLNVLGSIDFPKVTIHRQVNKGLGAARNFGVANSIGEILFFLDSDNRVRSSYFTKSTQIFLSRPDVGVVYSKPAFFGDNGADRFASSEYSFDKLLAGNFIDACAFVRREAFVEVGGFDEDRKLKISEDWDFWLRIGLTSWHFFFLEEALFDYRIRADSMIGTSAGGKKEATLRYLGEKHGFVIHKRYRHYFRVMNEIQEKPFRYFIRILYYKFILKKPFIG
jgi:glycosyltransferase involved in cell wall biosynthesis